MHDRSLAGQTAFEACDPASAATAAIARARPHPAWAVAAIAGRSGPVVHLDVPGSNGERASLEFPRAEFLGAMRSRGHEIIGKAVGTYAKMGALLELPRFAGFLGPLMKRDSIFYVAECFVDRESAPSDFSPDEIEMWVSLAHLSDEKRMNWIVTTRENIALHDIAEQKKQEAAEAEAARLRAIKSSPHYKLLQSCYAKRPRQVLRKARGKHWRLPGVVGSKAAWAIPATGGYGSGRDCGNALAKLYLQHVGKGDPIPGSNTLYKIVNSMFDKQREISARCSPSETLDGPCTEADTFRAQLLAFFEMVELAASAGVRFSSIGKTVNVDERSLIVAANRALSFDVAAYWAGLDELDQDKD